jgi:DNA-binding transcriptional MerR regulator
MEQRPEKLFFSIGEFAQMTGVPKQTLQFYDKIGIFSPAIRLDNGYRYYEAAQYDAIEIIYALKEAGLPLQEIKTYLDVRTPEMCIALLKQESVRIKEKVRMLERTLVMIEQKRSSTEKGIQAMSVCEISLEERPEEHMIIWDFSETVESDFMVEVIKMINWCYDHGYYTGYSMGSIIEYDSLLKGRYAKIGHMFMKIDHSVLDEKYLHRASGLYAVYNHRGRYDEMPKIYPRLIQTIGDMGYEVCGASYETGLLDFFSVREQSEYLVEISIPVQKSER